MASRYGTVSAVSGSLLHDRLRVERDSEPGCREHVEIVGPVADRHRLLQWHVAARGDLAEKGRLALAVDHRTDDLAGEPPVDDLELVGRGRS